MNKPITLARKNFIDDIVKLINNAGLPAFVIEDILKSCLVEITELANKQYQEDLKAYTDSLSKEAAGEVEE